MKKHQIFSKLFLGVLLVMTLALYTEFFIRTHIWGDIYAYGYWWLQLVKKHLASEWAMPYFTPGRCGGFLLAADAQVYIFSLYMLLHFFIPSVVLSVKTANFLLSIILVAGIYRWLWYFGIMDRLARLFTAIILSLTAYWVFHLIGGELHVHGMAYFPWVMVLLEELLRTHFQLTRQYGSILLQLIGFFFLLINSGYFWLQYAPFIIASRFFIEFFSPHKNHLQQAKSIGLIALCGGVAILLSWPRLGGIYEFQLTKFPRMGGAVNHMQIIGDTVYLLKTLVRSFFDRSVVMNGETSPYLGGYFEWSNFLGLSAVIPLLVGMAGIKQLSKSKAFFGLLLACLIQLAFVRTTHAADFIRALIPIYKQITHYWRGSPTLIFFAGVFIAIGYEKILKHPKRIVVSLGFILMFLNLIEFYHVYRPQRELKLYEHRKSPPTPLTEHFAPCELCHLFGYGYWDRIPEVLSFNKEKSVYDSPQPGFYNMHDVRRLFSHEADGGYYFKHPWPLWHMTDSAEFEKFINYKQVVSIPSRLRVMNMLSGIAWVLYCLAALWALKAKFGRKKTARMQKL